MTRNWLSFLMTTLSLLLAGAVAGLVVPVLGLALESALQSLQTREGEGLFNFLGDLFFLLLNVLSVSMVVAPDGIWSGLITAAAIALAYGLILFILPQLLFRRGILALILALVGAIAAPLSLRGVLVDYQVAAIIAGALFGVVAALALSRGQQSAPAVQSPQSS